LSQSTLLALVQYVHSNRDRSNTVAINGLGEASHEQSTTVNEHIGRDGSDVYQNSTTTERD